MPIGLANRWSALPKLRCGCARLSNSLLKRINKLTRNIKNGSIYIKATEKIEGDLQMGKESKSGVIYIMTNPSFENFVKIGYARDVESRLKQLNRSETTPYGFRVYAVYEVKSDLTDKELHKLIDSLRPDLRSREEFNGKERVREFYAMSAEDAYGLLECIAKISGTLRRLKRLPPDGHIPEPDPIQDRKRQQGPLCFSECGIPIGTQIEFVADHSIKATVVDDRHISYDGDVTTLSSLAKKLLGVSHPVKGTMYFSYHGEKLCHLRERKKMERLFSRSQNDDKNISARKSKSCKTNKNSSVPDAKKKQKPPLGFSQYGIPIGAELVFSEDNTKRVIVVDERHVMFDGELTTLSALGKKLKNLSYPVQGPRFFSYNGELLTEIRKRLEKKNDV